jgi:hypothetical protein
MSLTQTKQNKRGFSMVSPDQVISYLKTAYSGELDVERAILTVYLIDWRSAIDRGRQLSNIKWRIDNVPHPNDAAVILSAFRAPGYETNRQTGETNASHLSDEDRALIKSVAEVVARKSWADFIRLIFSTFPVLSQPKLAPVDLVAMADKYNREYRAALG